MAARAMWKGELKLDSTKIPVKLYSALQDRTVRFHILDSAKKRVKQHMVDSDTGDEVASEEIQKGFEVEPGTFVILEAEELESLVPEASRDIKVTRFVPRDGIGPEFYDRPYYLGPDGEETAYFALVEALRNKDRIGLARWVMRKQPYVGALTAADDYLMLVTLRHAEEVVSAKDLPRPTGRPLDKREISMANQLVEMLKGDFDPKEFKDEYRERVTEFVEQKAKGRAPKLRLVKTKPKTTSLESVLSKSIESLKKKGKGAA